MNPLKLGKLLYKKGNTRLGCYCKYTLWYPFVCLSLAWRPSGNAGLEFDTP
jgi:hypothetical protein